MPAWCASRRARGRPPEDAAPTVESAGGGARRLRRDRVADRDAASPHETSSASSSRSSPPSRRARARSGHRASHRRGHGGASRSRATRQGHAVRVRLPARGADRVERGGADPGRRRRDQHAGVPPDLLPARGHEVTTPRAGRGAGRPRGRRLRPGDQRRACPGVGARAAAQRARALARDTWSS